MKDSNSKFQLTLFKVIIIIYFSFIILNIFGNNVSFLNDNAEFGIWTIISFIIISSIIFVFDITIIEFISKIIKNKNKKVYILLIQSIICLIVYFGFKFMFDNVKNRNETEININQNSTETAQNIYANKQVNRIYIKDKKLYDQTFIDGLLEFNEEIQLIDNYLIIGSDTSFLPEDITLNTTVYFSSIKDNKKYTLEVRRTKF
jgi:hypothetical protein